MLINLTEKKGFSVSHKFEENPKQSDFLMHAHGCYELLIFISGDITYLVEGNTYHPKPWDILLFGIAETHKVTLCSSAPYERLVIQIDKKWLESLDMSGGFLSPFEERKLGENNIYRERDFEDNLCKSCLMRLKEKIEGEDIECLSLLLPVLSEIRAAYIKKDDSSDSQSLASKIVLHVNRNITKPLSPESIAQHFFISRTALYSIFRNATGTGIHEYINVKRLIMARELIENGEKPTKVYEKCGFKDYTTFFRAYKKRYLQSPKESQ